MKINTVNHFISDAFKSLKRNKTLCFASVVTVLITFCVVGIFVLVTKNVDIALNNVQSKVELSVFLKDNITLADQRNVEMKLNGNENVKEVSYVSKDQAFKNFEENTKGNEGLLAGYSLKNNPFPASYVVKLKNPEAAQSVGETVEKMAGVESIGNQQSLINTITKIVNAVKVVGIVLFLILVGVAVFLIANTTKLTVYSRRREIGIMKFVGATDWFIRWPFIIEGAIIGLIGSLIAVLIVFGGYHWFIGWITQKMLFVDMVPVSYVYTQLIWQFAIAGSVIGGLASYISLRKFLIV